MEKQSDFGYYLFLCIEYLGIFLHLKYLILKKCVFVSVYPILVSLYPVLLSTTLIEIRIKVGGYNLVSCRFHFCCILW